jgi:alanine-synthesizing transaminase
MLFQEEKTEKLQKVHCDIRGPILSVANQIEKEGHSVLHLNTGNPVVFGFSTPPYILRQMEEKLADSQGYCPSRGLAKARQAVVDYAARKGVENVGMEDVYIGNGVSELITMCMMALLNQGDEILIPAPDYPLWTASALLAGGNAVHYICDEEADWMPDLQDMRRKITPRTKAIVIINPNNPTGALYPKEILDGICDLAREFGLMIFSDEIYDRLVMDGKKHISIASLAPDLPVVTFNGLSKSHLVCGYRCGWMTVSGDKRPIRGFLAGVELLASMRLCSNVPAQQIIELALSDDESARNMVQPGGRIYEQREAAAKALSGIPGVSFVKNTGAFYIFPKLDVKKFGITDDEKFAIDFLKAKHVMLINGRGFNWIAPDHFRIVCLPQPEKLTKAIEDLGDFLEGYHQ